MASLPFRFGKRESSGSGVLVDANVSTNVTTSSLKEHGTGQVEKVVNKRGSTVNIDNSNHVINVNFNDLDDNAKKRLAAQLYGEFQNKEARIVCSEAQNEINDYRTFARTSPEMDLVEFFSGKISSTDLQILKTALYIHNLVEHEKFDEAKKVKANAVRANSRANHIINLTTSGYMRDYMRPVFEVNDLIVAQAHYDEVVTFLPEIIFVRNNMTSDMVMAEIEKKITKREQYHVVVVQRIIVAGIGGQCVDTITEVKKMVDEKYRYPLYEISFNTSSGTMPQARLQISLNGDLK